MERLTAWANTRNGRSQVALERVGFRREGVLARWHRHGDQMHDVVVFGMLRAAWEAIAPAGSAGGRRRHPAAPFFLPRRARNLRAGHGYDWPRLGQ